jgi:hypothetical protein
MWLPLFGQESAAVQRSLLRIRSKVDVLWGGKGQMYTVVLGARLLLRVRGCLGAAGRPGVHLRPPPTIREDENEAYSAFLLRVTWGAGAGS